MQPNTATTTHVNRLTQSGPAQRHGQADLPPKLNIVVHVNGEAKQPAKKKPFCVVKKGSVEIPIYGRKSGPFTIAWYESGSRKRTRRADLEDAKKLAGEKATLTANGQSAMLGMDQKDWASYLRTLELVATTGKPIELVAAEYTECMQILSRLGPNDPGLIAAVRAYVERQPTQGTPKTCPEILQELLRARKQDGAYKNTLDDFRSRLGLFTKNFTGPLVMITGADLNEWLRKLDVSRRTRNNYRDAIRELYRFAKQCKYVPKDWSVFDDVPRVKNEAVVVRIFTPEHMAKLLAWAKPNLTPFMAIGAFATVRSEEMAPSDPKLPRLDWREVDFETKEIRILPEVARKIGEDRIIPMHPNLEAWLKPYAKDNGPICELRNVPNALAQTAKRAGVEWISNGLRKSSISYRLAVLKNIERVAYEGGTSPERIRLNYKKTIPEKEAKKWYEIWPTNAECLQLDLFRKRAAATA